MVASMAPAQTLMINWPLQSVGSHRKAHELVSKGAIGDVPERLAYWRQTRSLCSMVRTRDERPRAGRQGKAPLLVLQKGARRRLPPRPPGYGTALSAPGTRAAAPLEVTTVVDEPAGPGGRTQHRSRPLRTSRLSVRNALACSPIPWTIQPQPKCGFIILGNRRHRQQLRLRRLRHRPNTLPTEAARGFRSRPAAPHQNPVQYLCTASTGEFRWKDPSHCRSVVVIGQGCRRASAARPPEKAVKLA